MAPEERLADIIRASEIGEYVYCARSWWLRQVQGAASRNVAALAAGRDAHDRHGRQVARYRGQRRLALALGLLGLTLLGLALALLAAGVLP